jgi:hypothetical protein
MSDRPFDDSRAAMFSTLLQKQPEHKRERIRLSIASSLIIDARIRPYMIFDGNKERIAGDDDAVRFVGYTDLPTYFRAKLARPMSFEDFVDFIKQFHKGGGTFNHGDWTVCDEAERERLQREYKEKRTREAERIAREWKEIIEKNTDEPRRAVPPMRSVSDDDDLILDLSIRRNLKDAVLSNQPFVYGDTKSRDFKKLALDPRAAAVWLLSMPTERGLLPPELCDFLSLPPAAIGDGTKPIGATAPVAAAIAGSATKRVVPLHIAKTPGARPVQRERVVSAMREKIRDGADLSKWTEESMKAEFGASRDTCRKARYIVLGALAVEK